MSNQLEACKKTRKVAIDALYKTLKFTLESKELVSEALFRDKWLENLRKSKNIYSDGWYIPPPSGMAVLFGPPIKGGRTYYEHLRVEKMWPRDDIYLTKENSIIYVYCSPVDKNTGVIGDIGLSIYLGKNPKVKNHLKKCLELNKKISDFIEVGKTVSEVNKYAFKVMEEMGLSNDVVAIHDPSGSNIGHSVPIPNKLWAKNEKETLISKKIKWEIKKDIISKKRIYFNAIEQTKFSKNTAMTIEPRLTSTKEKDIPLTSFHTILLIDKNGKKEFLLSYDKIFKLAGMDYLLK